MKLIKLITIGVVGYSLSACTHDRLYFVEKTHFGLRAELEPESQTPGNIHFGYKRSIATLIPCKEIYTVEKDKLADPHWYETSRTYCGENPDESAVKKDEGGNTKRAGNTGGKSNNILSVISSFNTRVTWFEGTRIQAFFATGEAATATANDAGAIKALVQFPEKIN